jgi:tetratricopeptide (TPR) repeat protein
VSVREGHQRIADFCWKEMQIEGADWSRYGLSHLATHLVELERWAQLLILVTNPALRMIDTWIQHGSERGQAYLIALARHLANHAAFDIPRAGICTQIARMFSLRGEYDDARTWLAEALRSTSRWRGRRIRAVALHENASLNLYEGENRKAEKLYRQALNLCVWGWPMHRDEAAANLIGLASVARAAMRFDKCLRLAKRAVSQAQRAGDTSHVVAGRRLIGTVYNTMGKYDEAQETLIRAITSCDEQNEHLEKGRTLLVLGASYNYAATLYGDTNPEARECFHRALEEGMQVNDYYVKCEAELSLGLYALAAEETAEAEEWFHKLSRKLLSLHQHPELHIGLAFGRAAIVQQRGDLMPSRQQYRKALNLCCDETDSFQLSWRARLSVAVGSTYFHCGEPDKADELWQQALQDSGRTSDGAQRLTVARIKLCKRNPRIVAR